MASNIVNALFNMEHGNIGDCWAPPAKKHGEIKNLLLLLLLGRCRRELREWLPCWWHCDACVWEVVALAAIAPSTVDGPARTWTNGYFVPCHSTQGGSKLLVRNSERKSPTKFEIWVPSQVEKEFHVSPSVHGSVYSDGWYNISYLLRVVFVMMENVFPEDSGFLTVQENSSDKECGSWKGQGDWEEDWGETYPGKRSFHFVINVNRCRALSGNSSFSWSLLALDGDNIVAGHFSASHPAELVLLKFQSRISREPYRETFEHMGKSMFTKAPSSEHLCRLSQQITNITHFQGQNTYTLLAMYQGPPSTNMYRLANS
ncbi:hypothetical protein HAX54_033415 [Datura stramonium]|uniref:Acylamino-acid-releasing enzyme N-terminal domain-containing protein n=1 Tax=Datura stramonium TaxID=4076 RepID=A0ABS8VCG2_DATST|nr:hypothetical protein [Datura stramonium]